MRGGYRYGAGRPSRNAKVETLLNIDIRQWASRGMLVPGKFFSWEWSRDGERIATIGVRIASPIVLTLEYDWMIDGEASRKVIESVSLERTSCHYGGNRVWFCCPHCWRRVAKLYLVKGHWYCRNSINVAYASQSEDMVDRIHRRITKFESKLEEDGTKPRRMHWVTYNRIIEKLCDAESRLDFAFYQRGR